MNVDDLIVVHAVVRGYNRGFGDVHRNVRNRSLDGWGFSSVEEDSFLRCAMVRISLLASLDTCPTSHLAAEVSLPGGPVEPALVKRGHEE